MCISKFPVDNILSLQTQLEYLEYFLLACYLFGKLENVPIITWQGEKGPKIMQIGFWGNMLQT